MQLFESVMVGINVLNLVGENIRAVWQLRMWQEANHIMSLLVGQNSDLGVCQCLRNAYCDCS